LNVDSTAPERTLANLFSLIVLVVDDPVTMLIEVLAKVLGLLELTISE
jgi:hypothetical protein